MGTIRVHEFISLDGVIEAPSWTFEYLVAPIARMFGLSLDIAMAPLAVQEMILAIWLIAKGFDMVPVETVSTARSPLASATA